MSLALLFRKSKSFTISTIVLDALISEDHNRSAVITDNPVEDGASFNDHIANDPITLSIEGFVTNTPTSLFANINSITAASDRVSTVFDDLNFLYEEKQLVQVVTNLKVYENMAIEHLNIPKDASTGEAFTFSIDFKKVTKIDKETTTIPKSKVGGSARTKAQAQGKVNAGKKVPGTPGATSTEKATSILKGIFK